MADEGLRDLERAWKEQGSEDAAERYLNALIRSGGLSPRQLLERIWWLETQVERLIVRTEATPLRGNPSAADLLATFARA